MTALDWGKVLDKVSEAGRTALSPLLAHQRPPTSDWDGWVLAGGRGIGKTYAGARWIGDLAAGVPGLRGRIIAPTLADAVNSVVLDQQSGITVSHPEAVLRTAGPQGTRVEWPNGSTVWCVGTNSPRDVDRLRALSNIDADHFEEAAANPNLEEAVYQARLSRRGLRLPKPLWIATTTPRPLPTIREWYAGGIEGEHVEVTRATTMDNPHTPDTYRAHAERLRGTRLYRQEVLGELLDDVEGALWTATDLEESTYRGDRTELLDRLARIAIGVDPPSGSGTCGIVVVGVTADGHVYVLDDYSVDNPSPDQWATAVTTAHRDYARTGVEPLVVAEINQGGRMVTSVLEQASASLPVTTVRAADGKRTRAEPVAILWEADEKLAHLAPGSPGALDLLTDQMLSWVPGTFSPDRVDALVWAVSRLRRGTAAPPRVSRAARTRRLST